MSLQSRSVSSPEEESAARPVKRKRLNLTRPMVRQACVMCAKKKARCSGGDPCEACMKNSVPCTYNPVQRRGPKVKKKPRNDSLAALDADQQSSDDSRSPPLHLQGPPPPLVNVYPDPSSPPHISPVHVEVHSHPTGASNPSDSGSLVTDRILQAEGPGVYYYMDILPQDVPSGPQASAPPITGHEALILPIATGGGATEVDLAKMAEHPDVTRGLYYIYWCFVHPSWPVLYRPSYDQLNAPTKYPMLHDAIMSVCCRLDLQRQTREMAPESRLPGLNADNSLLIGDFFLHRAEMRRQEMEVGGGDIHTVQALLVMTIRELGQNKLRSGWEYCGQALRLALFLNLHSDNPQVGYKEEERRRVIWFCYAVDKYISMIMGKPYVLRRETIAIPLPSTTESDEYAMWETDARMVIPGIAGQFDGVRCLTVSNFNAFVKLMVLIEKILDGISPSKRKSHHTHGSGVKDMDESLIAWVKQAGDVYVQTASLSTPPHRLLLKLWYYCCLILVHRRHMKETTTFNRNGKQVASHTICTDAANGICETVRMMEMNFGLYRFPSAVVFILFQAGIIHLSNSAAADSRASRHGTESLTQCIWWLDQIANTYGISPAHCDVLRKLKEMSGRELLSHHEITAIMASRRASRQNSPATELDMLFNGQSSLDHEHSNRAMFEALQPQQSIPGDIQHHTLDLGSNPFDVSNGSTSRSLDDNNVLADSSLLYGNLYDTFFSDLPINLPSNNDMSNWNIFQADYEALLSNQPYENH